MSRADLLKKKTTAMSSLESELNTVQLKVSLLDQQMNEKAKDMAARYAIRRTEELKYAI